MTMKFGTSAVAAVVLLSSMLAGCASAAPEPTAPPEPVEVEEVEYATEPQVASVIAKYESDWREVIDGAGECRLNWVNAAADESDLLSSLEGYSCFMREKTLGVTAQLAVRDLEELEIPPSMETLVSETKATLLTLSSFDLEAICGTEDAPADTPECQDALGTRNYGYGVLEDQLAAWGPYL